MDKVKKKLKNVMVLVLSLALAFQTAIPAGAAGRDDEQQLKVAVLSDTHYLSPSMIKDTEDYKKAVNSDRKMFSESSAILDMMLEDVKKDKPDVLMISGDLTKDGEKKCHEEVAAKLEAVKKSVPGMKVYVVPGNHDINNSNALNFNTADGKAVAAEKTTPDDFKKIYSVSYEDESVIATFTPQEGAKAGGLTYVARPQDGYTVIAIDSACYSADNTKTGKDEHETRGALSKDLQKWIVKQILAAKKRGDTVIGLAHHGFISHYSVQEEFMPMYLLDNYEKVNQMFADAGMSYIFTGHGHSSDTASITTEEGNTLIDIETGSTVTYPSPRRSVVFKRNFEDGKVQEVFQLMTKIGFGPVTFTNPSTGKEETIDDLTAYGREKGFSEELLSTMANEYVHDFCKQVIAKGGSKEYIKYLLQNQLDSLLKFISQTDGAFDIDLTIEDMLVKLIESQKKPEDDSQEQMFTYNKEDNTILVTLRQNEDTVLHLNVTVPALKEALKVLLARLDKLLENPKEIDEIVNKLMSSVCNIPVTDDGSKTLLQFVNFAYQTNLAGSEPWKQPDWVEEALNNIQKGKIVDDITNEIVKSVAGAINEVFTNLPLKELLGTESYDAGPVMTMEMGNFLPTEGRTSLIQPADIQTSMLLAFMIQFLGWTADEDSYIFSMPEGSDPEVGYSIKDFLDGLGNLGININVEEALMNWMNGTPADPETGTEATEGFITKKYRQDNSKWLERIARSFLTDGADMEDIDDNNILYNKCWILSDRTKLKDAIKKAEDIVENSIEYTPETISFLKKILEEAKNLKGSATQSEVDLATNSLETAIRAVLKHEHTYATEWTSDTIYHYHVAVCEDAKDPKARNTVTDMAPHSFGPVTTEADGTKTRVCIVCGYKETVTEETEVVSAHEMPEADKTKSTTTDAAKKLTVKVKTVKGIQTVTWKKVKGAKGYDIFAGAAKAKKLSRVKTVSSSKTSVALKKALGKKYTSKKTYQIRVKAYTMEKGKKKYLSESKILKSVKAK